MLNGHLVGSITTPSNWAKESWIMVYVFSDEAANKYGFGAYAAGAGAEYFEKSAAGTFDMDVFVGTKNIRFGTTNLG